MSAKLPKAKKHLAETISENWSDQLELGGSQSGYVACYAANQVLGTIWRGGKDDPNTKQIRDEATLSRVSDIGARDVVEAMLAGQMVAAHEAAMECFRRAALAEQTLDGEVPAGTPYWPWSLAAYLVIGVGAVALTARRLAVPTATLARGMRIA